MLFTKMDLLNYQYLDKMNNNIGILCYEGNISTLTLWLLVNEMKYFVSENNGRPWRHRVELHFHDLSARAVFSIFQAIFTRLVYF